MPLLLVSETSFAFPYGKFGIKLIEVSEADTSQTCHNCHVRDKAARKTQGMFECKNCRSECNADYNGSMNIMQRALGILSKVGGILDYPRTSGDCRQKQNDHRGIPHASAMGVVTITNIERNVEIT